MYYPAICFEGLNKTTTDGVPSEIQTGYYPLQADGAIFTSIRLFFNH